MPEPRHMPFTVACQRQNGTVTYFCATATVALRKVRDFENAGYTGITITGPGNARLTEPDLLRIVEGNELAAGGAPSVLSAARFPASVA